MTYKSLGKLYYGDSQVYAQTYKDRFGSEDAVKLNFSIAQNQAFFVQNTEVMKLAYDISKLNNSVLKLSMKLPEAAKIQYSRKCLIDEIVLTNKIEGVHSSRKEINEALDVLEKQSKVKGKHNRFIGLVNKYLKLMIEEEVPLSTCQDVRDLYDEVFLDEVFYEDPQNVPDGKIFRKEISEVHSAADKIIHTGLYPEEKIINAMINALDFLNDDKIDHLFRICVFHYLIEYIHPFYDGNGRLGRFILSYRISEILEPLVSYRISETIKENIKEYYKAFEICNDARNLGDLTPFLIMMLNMIYSALKDLEASLERKFTSWNKYELLIPSLPNAEEANVHEMYSYLTQAALFSEQGISTEELKDIFNVSYNTIKRLLGKLPPEMLISQKNGKAKYYQIDLNVLNNIILDKEMKEIAENN